jgi:hypothetical protein
MASSVSLFDRASYARFFERFFGRHRCKHVSDAERRFNPQQHVALSRLRAGMDILVPGRRSRGVPLQKRYVHNAR